MSTPDMSIKVAVVTGGHAFDVDNFDVLFGSYPDMQVDIQDLDDFCNSSAEARAEYNVVVFYTMYRHLPNKRELTDANSKHAEVLNGLGETEQGIVIMHHSLCAYLEWGMWDRITGVKLRRKGFAFHAGETVPIHVEDPGHPITRGMDDWEHVDETYEMPEPEAGCYRLLTTSHPQSMNALAWARQFRNSPVFVIQCGHDKGAWEHPSFREVLHRGIQWAGGSL